MYVYCERFAYHTTEREIFEFCEDSMCSRTACVAGLVQVIKNDLADSLIIDV